MFPLKEICFKLSCFEFLLLPFLEKVKELSLNLNVFQLVFSSGYFAFSFHKQTCLEALKKLQIHNKEVKLIWYLSVTVIRRLESLEE